MSRLRCIIQVMGGLGNQMFQYALGRSLELQQKADVCYELSQFRRIDERELSIVKYRTIVRPISRVDRITMRLSLGRSLKRMRPLLRVVGLGAWRVHDDPRKGCDESVRDLRGRWYLCGWWQSPTYFEPIRATLLSEFQPVDALTGANLELADQIQSTNSVCVHIRRGDFVSSPIYSRIVKVQSEDYFLTAMKEINRRTGGAHFFVFSDDAQWARENIRLDAPIEFVNHNGPKSDYLDLHLMSRCRHFVTSNSTFSWWAAWLARSPGKIVIVPPVWGVDGSGPPPGLIPADWQIGPRSDESDSHPARTHRADLALRI